MRSNGRLSSARCLRDSGTTAAGASPRSVSGNDATGRSSKRRAMDIATGLVTYALRQAGLSADHDGVERGVSWLLRHQDQTGSWPGYSLNKERDPSADAARFMNDVATAYAVLALADTN